jgi:hypothetical protein
MGGGSFGTTANFRIGFMRNLLLPFLIGSECRQGPFCTNATRVDDRAFVAQAIQHTVQQPNLPERDSTPIER